MKRIIATSVGAFVTMFLGVAVVASPASAATSPIYANDWQLRDWHGTYPDITPTEAADSKVACTKLALTKPAGDVGTSYENPDLGIAVHDGDTVTVNYTMSDVADAAAGAVRMFAYDAANADTSNAAPTFGPAIADGSTVSGTLTLSFTGDATIGTFGLTYDASNATEGTVTFTNLAINKTPIAFCSSAPQVAYIQSRCHPDEWYVNPDEWTTDTWDDGQADRRPTATENGFTFQGTQLMHHATTITTDQLTPGSYTANPAPSLDSFFSVEVRNDDGSGYATLRWDTTRNQWNIGGTDFWDANPTTLVTGHGKSTQVFSFGVGYVNTPSDGTPTTVASVTFAGTTYDLTCAPPTDSDNAPAPADTTTTPATLPVTGSSGLPQLVAAGVALIGVGVAALILVRRRRNHVGMEQ